MADVFINPELEQTEILTKLIDDLFHFLRSNREIYPSTIGNFGAFEDNPRAMLANINKVHVAVSAEDFTKWKHKKGQDRKSDNYLIYTTHDLEPDTYLILDFISPKAHKTIRNKLANLVLFAEEFQNSYYEKLFEKYLCIKI